MISRHRADLIAGLITGVPSVQGDWDSHSAGRNLDVRRDAAEVSTAGLVEAAGPV